MVFDSLSSCLVVGPLSRRRCTWRCWGCVHLYNWCMPWWQQTTKDPDRSRLEWSYWLCWRTTALIWFYRSFRNYKTKQQMVRTSFVSFKIKRLSQRKIHFKNQLVFYRWPKYESVPRRCVGWHGDEFRSVGQSGEDSTGPGVRGDGHQCPVHHHCHVCHENCSV